MQRETELKREELTADFADGADKIRRWKFGVFG
jgi:hypothetical protein